MFALLFGNCVSISGLSPNSSAVPLIREKVPESLVRSLEKLTGRVFLSKYSLEFCSTYYFVLFFLFFRK